jgi:hypothetical protein
MTRVECKYKGCKNLTQPGKYCLLHNTAEKRLEAKRKKISEEQKRVIEFAKNLARNQ